MIVGRTTRDHLFSFNFSDGIIPQLLPTLRDGSASVACTAVAICRLVYFGSSVLHVEFGDFGGGGVATTVVNLEGQQCEEGVCNRLDSSRCEVVEVMCGGGGGLRCDGGNGGCGHSGCGSVVDLWLCGGFVEFYDWSVVMVRWLWCCGDDNGVGVAVAVITLELIFWLRQ
ncbi:Hypothetical predicted protein [Olea europaea subsp. europaea]|uniref:Uncharacterized protein n=1 Tax=Olea europaea subsp. europaea TaxID=158383 RepID=A0A8S0TRP7_OLEEU|nr:Hypothetical predicted protein [Olea europaea subsp. europaea]